MKYKKSPLRHAYRAVVKKALPGTQGDIRLKTGLGVATVSRWVNDLHASSEAYVKRWDTPTNGPFMAVYARGRKPDAPRPAAKTVRERTESSRRGQRTNGAWEDRLAAGRARYWAEKPAARDPMTAALFGAAK